MAGSFGITAIELKAAGIVDRIIPEYSDAADEEDAFCRRVGAFVEAAIRELAVLDQDDRLARRLRRYQR